METQVVDLAVRLGEVAVRNTAGLILDRIRAAKTKRDDAETIAELEEIISSLIADKNEVVQIAQAFEQEFVAQRISDDDINYITTNLVPIIEHLAEAGSSPGDSSTQETIDLIKPLLSTEVLKVLQVLGFNFKQAVGEPLTILLREFVLANVPRAPSDASQQLDQQQTIEALRLAQNPEAFARFLALGGSSNPVDAS
jgi:hypothetical protein